MGMRTPFRRQNRARSNREHGPHARDTKCSLRLAHSLLTPALSSIGCSLDIYGGHFHQGIVDLKSSTVSGGVTDQREPPVAGCGRPLSRNQIAPAVVRQTL